MSGTLTQIAQQLKDSPKKVQLIYAFNGVGKTRLSREFKELVEVNPSAEEEDTSENSELAQKNILYYSAFTEDLFYWDNDLTGDEERKLKIHPNAFTNWVFVDQGKEQIVIGHFQRYTNDKLTPHFNEEYLKDKNDPDSKIKAFSEIKFSFERGDDEPSRNIKISKAEESNLIWCIFYSLFEEIISVLNTPEEDNRETDSFNNLEYVFIDDPVTSLDENHLIELAVDLAELIKSSESKLKFIITTHNPLFYNVLTNELNNANKNSGYKRKHYEKYRLSKKEDGSYELINQPNDSPFSYHLYIVQELKKAYEEDKIKKYHFNLLRNLLEKLSTFLGYNQWKDLLEPIKGESAAYYNRIVNLYSHSKHSSEEVTELNENDKRVFKFLVNQIITIYNFKNYEV
jgi:hypothetical protein